MGSAADRLHALAKLEPNRGRSSYGFAPLCRSGSPLILLPDGGKPTRFRIVRETFFIYAIHFAPVRLFNKTGNLFAHGSSAAALFLYVGMPGLIVLMTAMVSAAGRRYAPRLYGLFTGGRGTPGWKDR